MRAYSCDYEYNDKYSTVVAHYVQILCTGIAPDHVEILQPEKESRDRSGPKRSRFSYEQLVEISPIELAAESILEFYKCHKVQYFGFSKNFSHKYIIFLLQAKALYDLFSRET